MTPEFADTPSYIAVNPQTRQASLMTNLLTIQTKGEIACPQCGDPAHRVKRRLSDRIVSFIKPVKRYRCDFCDWTGTVPVQAV